MSVIAAPAAPFAGVSYLRRFSVDEYHQMIETGILDDEDHVELLEGYVVLKRVALVSSHGGKVMSLATAPVTLFGGASSFHRFSVDEYHQMIATGILDDEDRVELLEGYVVLKMPRNPPHDNTIPKLNKRLLRLVPNGWQVRGQSAVTLTGSEPEPDLVVARGDENTYAARHPGPGDIALAVEVSDSSLARDRGDKGRIYAQDNIPIYWIVNVVDMQVEVFTSPSGPAAVPGYAQRQDYRPGDTLPLVLDGILIGTLPVHELLP